MLEVRNLCLAWRGAPVVTDARFCVPEGAIAVLTGANGAGKSSLIAALAGLAPVRSGQVVWHRRDVTALPLHRRRDMAIVPEGRHLAPSMTILDTLRLGAGRQGRRRFAAELDRVFARFPVLADRRDQLAGTLSGGEAQMLAMGRALIARPRLLFLDEPTLGLSPAAARAALHTLRDLRDGGMGIVLADQDSCADILPADRLLHLADGRLTAATPTPLPQPA